MKMTCQIDRDFLQRAERLRRIAADYPDSPAATQAICLARKIESHLINAGKMKHDTPLNGSIEKIPEPRIQSAPYAEFFNLANSGQ